MKTPNKTTKKAKFFDNEKFTAWIKTLSKEALETYLKRIWTTKIYYAEKYTNDPIFRKKAIERVNKYYKEKSKDPLFIKNIRQQAKERYANDPVFRKKCIETAKNYYKEKSKDPIFRKKCIETAKNYYKEKSKDPIFRKKDKERSQSVSC